MKGTEQDSKVIGHDYEIDPNHLLVGSSYDFEGDKPIVVWTYQGREGELSLVEARQRSFGLKHAAIVGEVEASLINGFVFVQNERDERSNLSEEERKAKESDDTKNWIGFMHLVRDLRSPVLPGIEVIYGAESKEARLNLAEEWYGIRVQMDFAEAIHHAEVLSAAAEAAETDAFMIYFLREKVQANQSVMTAMMRDFRQYRHDLAVRLEKEAAEAEAEAASAVQVPIGLDVDGNPIVMNIDESSMPFGQPKSGTGGFGNVESD